VQIEASEIFAKKDKGVAIGRKGSRMRLGADRGSWIEEVVNNSMRDVAHRYEVLRMRKISGPQSRGPPLVIRICICLHVYISIDTYMCICMYI